MPGRSLQQLVKTLATWREEAFALTRKTKQSHS